MNIHPWNRALWVSLTADLEHLPHGLLLHGAKGVGKKTFALALAKRMLCEMPTAEGACDQCSACNWFEQGSHPDFRLIEPAELSDVDTGSSKKGGKQIAIQDIRVLGEYLSLAAHQGGWRVIVLHPAESMNPAAANALLKTLEEPPHGVLLILVSHQPRRLLPTVLSRCRKIPVALPNRDEALAWLHGQGLDQADSMLREAGGAPLMALEYGGAERHARREHFLDVLSTPSPLALSELAQVSHSRLDEAWGWLSRWVHDLMRVKQQNQACYFPEWQTRLSNLVVDMSLPGLLSMEEELRRSGRWLRHPLNTQLLLESWLLRYAEIVKNSHGR